MVVQVAAVKIGRAGRERDLPAAFSCCATAQPDSIHISERAPRLHGHLKATLLHEAFLIEIHPAAGSQM